MRPVADLAGTADDAHFSRITSKRFNLLQSQTKWFQQLTSAIDEISYNLAKETHVSYKLSVIRTLFKDSY